MSIFSAVYFEQKEYDKCIQECQQAVEIGRENRSDFKLIAKYVSNRINVLITSKKKH